VSLIKSAVLEIPAENGAIMVFPKSKCIYLLLNIVYLITCDRSVVFYEHSGSLHK